MVVFEEVGERIAVRMNGHLIGHISPRHGFHLNSGHMETFIQIGAKDLRQIAEKAEEVAGIEHPQVQLV